MKVVTVEEMRRIEAAAIAQGISATVLMESAGRACADEILKRVEARTTVLSFWLALATTVGMRWWLHTTCPRPEGGSRCSVQPSELRPTPICAASS